MTGPANLITELGYLGFEVSDLSAWERFGGDVLGLAVSAGPLADTRLMRMDNRRYRFLLSEGPADDLSFCGWQSPNSASVDAFSRHLDACGVAWAWGDRADLELRSVQKMLHFKDPAGNRHEVYCGPALSTDRFVSPKVASGFVTGDGGLGHIVFSSGPAAEMVEFAQTVMGFGVSDVIRVPLGPDSAFEVSFLHANSRHHSFAVAPQPPTPGPHKSIHHFMIEVASVEEVGFGRDRCLAMKQPVSMDIGQHPNDRMISYYGVTPSGFHVEFGWGGIPVDRDTWQVGAYDRLSEWGHRPSMEISTRPASASGANKETTMSANGKWNVTMKTPMGDQQVVFDLTVTGDTVTGFLLDSGDSIEIFDGSIVDGQPIWKAKVNKPIPMELTFTATVDGDAISGAANSPFGAAQFAGARAG